MTRLQKYLSERGIASRRTCAEIIKSGRVSVNGMTVLEPGHRIDPASDAVNIDGNKIPEKEQHRTIIIYKPRGYICSKSAHQGKTVFELLKNIPESLVTVGRLDKNSEGLLLMTNNGGLANLLTHPRYEQSKVYEVTVSGHIDKRVMEHLNSAMVVDGHRIRPAKVRKLRLSSRPNRHVLEFILQEGRNRQIRHMCSAVGLRIHRLVGQELKTLHSKD